MALKMMAAKEHKEHRDKSLHALVSLRSLCSFAANSHFIAASPRCVSARACVFRVDAFFIVLPENWTGGLDGGSEETIIPSREIYETTT